MSKIQITPKWKDVKPQGYYVYVHSRATDSAPFYVGMGQNKRAWATHSDQRSLWWHNISMKHGVIVSISHDGLTKDQAILLEMWLIAKFRFINVNIVNLTDGGEGSFGSIVSEKTRDAISNSKKGIPRSVDTRILLGKAVVASNGIKFDTISLAVEYLKSIGHSLANQSSISMCCMNKLKTAYGLRWKWADGEFSVSSPHGLSVKVKTSTGETFDSITDASIYVMGSKSGASNISACINGRQKTAYGMEWYYG